MPAQSGYIRELWPGRRHHALYVVHALYDFAALGPKFGCYQASINANNVADDQVAGCNSGYCYLGQGRTVIGTLRYRW